jgi:predicted anti-sigma-YlaC factor YlaD
MTKDMNQERMTCKELVELVTAYLEDVMDADTRARFEAHLAKCRGCRNYLDQFRITAHTVGRVRDVDLDPAFRDRLLAAFREWR